MQDNDAFKKIMESNSEEIDKILESGAFKELEKMALNMTTTLLAESYPPLAAMRADITSKVVTQYELVDSQEFVVSKEVEKLMNYITMLHQLTDICEKIQLEQLRKEGA